MQKKVIVPLHPLVVHNLSLIRDKESSREVFLNAFERLSYFLVQEGMKNLPEQEVKITTPLAVMKTKKIDDSYTYIIAPILRAGLALTQKAVEMLPIAHVLHIGMFRDESTHQPVWYYNKTPEKFPVKTKVFILDPMLATGGSVVEVVKLFVEKGVSQKDIVFISVLSAPEGISLLHQAYPDVEIVTGAIDSYLNENAYIVPGLGDAGDRYFNS